MDSLDEIALRHGTDKATGQHGFTEIYEPLFEPLRDQEMVVLEIGVFEGASVRTWEDYFPNAKIVGVDTNWAAMEAESDRVTVHIGDQADPAFLASLVDLYGGFGIVIDDGGHFPDQQITSLMTLWPAVTHGGIYAIEDIHTSYLSEWGGAWRRHRTIVEVLKQVVDDVNVQWHERSVVLPDLASLSFHRELAVLAKCC